ncbi:MAG: HEPN domain-containing protein [Butyrivibrio sp.]|nr:HEPN domain-containing protein [Acetatifactor muris]MCM1559225.1 HEPN domain-containing protein [Butyrivibrio sp.]
MDELVKHRFSTAEEKIVSAQILMEAGQYRDSVGRSYYAIFSALRAVLATREVDFSKHSGVIAYFQKEFIKTGIFDVKFSRYIQQAFQIRNSCDYDDFFIASRQDAEEQYMRADELLRAVREYLAD